MKRKHGVFFGIAVLLIAAMFTLAGCDNGTTSGNGNGGGVPSGPGTGGNPVLGSGEIWVWDDDTDQGIRFESSNFCFYFKNNNTWGSRTVEGSWSGSTITYTGGSFTTTFTVSGNKLYEYSSSGTHVATYTKTTGQTGIYGNGNGGGQQNSWPNSTILAEYGLSGMTAPAGVTNITYSIATVGGHSLTIYFTGSSANDNAVKSAFISSGWEEDNDASYGDFIAILYTKAGFLQGSYTRQGTNCQIQSAKD